MVMATTETFVSAKEAAEILGVSKWTLYRWRKRGWIIGVVLPNGTIRIARSNLDRILEGDGAIYHSLAGR
jgi:excisionase family DNA binding protein